ncbi:MAG: hypothetical protein RMK00_01885 [Bacteroidota bacterium]|nr:hypothetical protein [Bacteroidota bacterium]
MNAERQEWFYRNHFSTARYARLRELLQQRLGTPIEFRIMEAPIFMSAQLRSAIARAATELVQQCTSPDYLSHAIPNAIPEQYRMPDIPSHPTCAVVDFAIVHDGDTYQPRLIELQGFPSLFAYQVFLAQAYHEAYELPEEFSPFFDPTLTMDEYQTLLQRLLLGTHHPDNTALVDYRPFDQKTYPDFAATEILTGVAPTDICSLELAEGTLFHRRGGALQPLRRIYMRAICDELEQYGVSVPFSWSSPPNVEWVVHPNWYFLLSKYSLPFLVHSVVPKAVFCSQIRDFPAGQWVLKPLYSFAGKGVNVEPRKEDFDSIPHSQRHQWILMEKVAYAPALTTPEGPNYLEVRCMIIWEQGATPRPTMSLVRTGRTQMMGSRYLTLPWTGASICFFTD